MKLTEYEEVQSLVRTLVNADRTNERVVTSERLREHVDRSIDLCRAVNGEDFGEALDRAALIREIETFCNVYIADAGVMVSDADHVPWLEGDKDRIDWRFWNRYLSYLSLSGSVSFDGLGEMDRITDTILGRLESPTREGSWDQRGLVAGQVQSGKTGNYIGLICKALDAGYKLVIVLAGMHNSLRAQTQQRVDEGVLGFDTEKTLRYDADSSGRVGVGNIGQHLHVNSFTSRKENGDFTLRVAEQVGVIVGGADPVVLVIKKNKSVLQNVLRWATNIAGETDPVTKKKIVRDVPLLLIDDEADQASVDTNGPRRGAEDDEFDPTVINGLVRKLLDRFQQSSYVGYTATPFANIFIDPDTEHSNVGAGLFPRSFIVSLPAPSNYVGPAQVFGLAGDAARSIERVEPLPIVRRLSDYDAWIPDRHNKSCVPGPLPKSLKTALMSFIIVCAVREFRGQGHKHNSMLVHVTRFVDVQERVRNQLADELERIQDHLEIGDEATDSTWIEMRKLYESDFLETSRAFPRPEELRDQLGEMPSWKDLAAALPSAGRKLELKLVNGSVKDALDYTNSPVGKCFVAIGGAKLSRGLTLDGLSVSYYLRGSRMYDTLMQMGRWFGYRPGYLDLCRLFTTRELTRWYCMITEASQELYQEFEYMRAIGKTPREFGLRVQQHPDGLMVTSPNRMRTATRISLTFAGNLSQTVVFRTDEATVDTNLKALDQLVQQLRDDNQVERMPAPGASHVWKSVPVQYVLDFLRQYVTHDEAIKVQPRLLSDYIMARNQDDPPELTDWWVVLDSKVDTDAHPAQIGGLSVRLATRGWHSDQKPDSELESRPERFPIRNLIDPQHERIDLDPESPQYSAALEHTQLMWRESPRADRKNKTAMTPSGIAVRAQRDPSTAVLVIYPLDPKAVWKGMDRSKPLVAFAISFPGSRHARPVEYQVTRDAWQQLYRSILEDLTDDLAFEE